jgi:NitT/TauT family transport system permease protein
MKPLAVERSGVGGGVTEAPEQQRSDRRDWPALPQRSRPRRASPLLTIRAPISRRARITLTVLSFAIPLLVWIVLSAIRIVPANFLPSPMATVSAGWELIKSGELFTDLWATLQRVVYGFGLAVLISVPLGILMGTFQFAQSLFEPFTGLMRYLPATAFIPLLMIWLGLEEGPKIALLVIGTVFFNTLMTADVVRSVPRALIDVSYTLGARRGEVLRKVIVPHSLPGIIDAIRVNAAAAWNLVVVAELIAATAGLGKRIILAQRLRQTDDIFAVLIVIGLVGVLIDFALRLIRERVGRWVA